MGLWIADTRNAAEPGSGLVYKSITGKDLSGASRPCPNPRMWGTVAFYPVDIVVIRKTHNPATARPKALRGAIVGLSAKSARRLAFTARNVEGFRNMITLTYPADYPMDGRIVKKHWEKIRHWLTYRKVGGLWWLEFQQRGAPHLHVFTTGRVNKEELSRAWFKIVASGDEKHLRAGTRVEALRKPHAVAAYAAKYAKKQAQKEVPEGFAAVGRLWGLFGGCKCEPERIISGDLAAVAPAIRAIRRADNASRIQNGQRTRKEKGLYSFVAYDHSRALSERLET